MDRQAFVELKAGGKLPSPSGVALRILDLTRQEQASVQDLARVVQADPALSGRLIKFANSAMAGPRRPVAAVSDAIRLLGIGTVRQLALGFSVLGQNRTGACKVFDYSGFWSRSLASAIAANALCLRTRTAPADEAFTCGLLARIGTLALATLYPERYGEVLQRTDDLREREREIFDTDHAELTAALLEDWMLPRLFVGAVFHHEDPQHSGNPEGSREGTLCHLIALAVGIGTYCGSDDGARRVQAADLIFQAARIGIDADALATLTDQIVVEWREWARILEVQASSVPSFASVTTAPPPVVTVSAEPPSSGAPGEIHIPKTDGEPLRVLVVDDDTSIRSLVELVLTERGHIVRTARNGQEALKLAMLDRSQMIVSDWVMPELDGIGLCRALRATDEGRQMYFLLLTVLEKEDHLVEAFEAGVDDFVTKPFSPRVLTARLRAGERMLRLREESQRDSQNLRRFATELAVANRRLRQAALTDPLTSLPNRRYAMERLEQEWGASSRNQRPLTVMMIDIDRFKAVNDTHGHDVGDQVLRQVALSLRKAARTEDVICRLGGEEFLVISPDTAAVAGQRLGDRLRHAIGGAPLNLGTLQYPVTVAIGVAERTPQMTHHDALLKAADEALYQGKREGGNRTRVAGGAASAAATPAG
ncbi:MAG: HDOD domain-containing protein [Burkholderiales bacterium]|nr:HDOD domain-containing protein [Burkholderiales bacterium]